VRPMVALPRAAQSRHRRVGTAESAAGSVAPVSSAAIASCGGPSNRGASAVEGPGHRAAPRRCGRLRQGCPGCIPGRGTSWWPDRAGRVGRRSPQWRCSHARRALDRSFGVVAYAVLLSPGRPTQVPRARPPSPPRRRRSPSSSDGAGDAGSCPCPKSSRRWGGWAAALPVPRRRRAGAGTAPALWSGEWSPELHGADCHGSVLWCRSPARWSGFAAHGCLMALPHLG